MRFQKVHQKKSFFQILREMLMNVYFFIVRILTGRNRVEILLTETRIHEASKISLF